MQNFDVVILGAGISGLAYGRLLQQHKPDATFLVLEKESVAGGLCRTAEVNGNHIDTGGGHFLYSKHQEVYDFVFSHVPKKSFEKHDRITKIAIHDQFIDYPIEQNLWQLPPHLQFEYISSLIDNHTTASDEEKEATSSNSPDEKPGDFLKVIVEKLGRAICENYLIPYNEKIWGVPVDELGTEWVYKIPKAELKSILRSLIMRCADETVMPSHPYFYYPRTGGFQVIPDAIYEQIKDRVLLNTSITSIKRDDQSDRWIVNGEFSCKYIINTVPWKALSKFIYHENFMKLKHNSLVVSARPAQYDHEWHWCYIPPKNVPQHREFFASNYARNNAQKLIVCETNRKRYTSSRLNLFEHKNEFAYPIPVAGSKKAIDKILKDFGDQNLHGLGRWGQWQYHNSDVCIYEAMRLFEKLEGVTLIQS